MSVSADTPSGSTTPSIPEPPAGSASAAVATNSSLEDLQSDQQRQVLDTVSQIRKCGLDSLLSLPQIVVCGDQSAGKSSVLEALSEIPFPRNDNLCTRYATEISLRREPTESLTIRIIPDHSRSAEEQDKMKAFAEAITDFSQLPGVMERAQEAMGISASARAFALDTLSIAICGPSRPQLTLVDIPGLIHSSTKGVSEEDLAMVGRITDRYIQQPRTICLAVISATNDAANQGIIQRIRKVDPKGERTLGVITKLDKLDAGSGSEQAFLALARNEDVFFQLGWHCIKNRTYTEGALSFKERNQSECEFFVTSAFSALPKDNVGIAALRGRLSQLLFEHVKKELPRLQADLKAALEENKTHLKALGGPRSSVPECRTFLSKLNMELYEISKAALSGNYEHTYFKKGNDVAFSIDKSTSVARLRAAVQQANIVFDESCRNNGHKFLIDFAVQSDDDVQSDDEDLFPAPPTRISQAKAIRWVRNALLRSRGTELVGNFNPRLISELFWEQSEKWETASLLHIELISGLCRTFLCDLVDEIAPHDVRLRMRSMVVHEAIEARLIDAKKEVQNLMEDRQADPVNYNHYYTDTINKKRMQRTASNFRDHLAVGMQPWSDYSSISTAHVNKIIQEAVESWGNSAKTEADMEKFSCEDALDSLLALYKVQRKVFVANVTTQVVERRMIRGLDIIFSPMVAVEMPDAKLEALVAEPPATKRERTFREDRIRKLKEGQRIFRGALSY
ncbi:interferon-induced GTP-binding protein Mx [Coniella lustricola]|uniref:Interferon-induced GTP-binding protein Mx n=1 Tax=Coniella lustricola TaxID=2025994 RepID=A0A2T2ZV58_9PEZI|nr:interferon-induced GTP-binding protein Mx [Coniella lustricola]